MKNLENQIQRDDEVRDDFNMLMQDYPDIHDSQSLGWRKIGDFFEQFSLYDQFQQSVSSNQLQLI